MTDATDTASQPLTVRITGRRLKAALRVGPTEIHTFDIVAVNQIDGAVWFTLDGPDGAPLDGQTADALGMGF
ncbi:hypothetical protein [Streptomyces olivoreticuli]|uniref:hypothetical protein n=1 Tax=Streptomyces olivoreticuli TaxID=68246 RepID=UPI000E273A49|nr:hypothetical protein [Streptomyces olivoreticuli]